SSSQTKAAGALSALGLRGSPTTAFNDDVAVDIVISQDPSAGTKVAPGSIVSYVVSKGPAPRTLTITPANLDMFINGTADLSIALDRPAPIAGIVVKLSAATALIGVPDSVTISAGQTQAGFKATAGPSAGQVTVTASSLGVTSGSAKITIKDNVPPD